MSYILDALRRAEAERERGTVPGLHAQAAGTAVHSLGAASAGRSRWTLPAFGVLVAAVVLLGWRPWVVVDRPAPAASPGAAVAPTAGSPPAPSAPPREPALDPAATPARTAPAPLAEAPVRRAAAPAAVKKRSAEAAGSAVAASRAPPLPASDAAAAEKVYALTELPPDIRQQLPPIAIGGSIDSTSAASRFVIVDGQLFREGDTLAPGLVLLQIRLKSAVLSFRGYRYRIGF